MGIFSPPGLSNGDLCVGSSCHDPGSPRPLNSQPTSSLCCPPLLGDSLLASSNLRVFSSQS